MGENQGNGQGTLDLEPEPKKGKEPEKAPTEGNTEPEQTKKLLPPLLATVICTIGYTQKSAEQFFKLLKDTGVTVLIDIRANASYGISGFTFRRDFAYFCKLHGIKLVVLEALAPSSAIRDAYKSSEDWTAYERGFIALLNRRKVFSNSAVRKALFEEKPEGAICFLCAEPTAEKCHRRLVVEHLLKFVPNADQITVKHL